MPILNSGATMELASLLPSSVTNMMTVLICPMKKGVVSRTVIIGVY